MLQSLCRHFLDWFTHHIPTHFLTKNFASNTIHPTCTASKDENNVCTTSNTSACNTFEGATTNCILICITSEGASSNPTKIPMKNIPPQPINIPHHLPGLTRLVQHYLSRLSCNNGTNLVTLSTHKLFLQHMFDVTSAFRINNKNSPKGKINTLLVGDNSKTTRRAFSSELGSLENGVNGHFRTTNTINFIGKGNFPLVRKVAYTNFVCDHRPLKN